jgi:hypothetical protein
MTAQLVEDELKRIGADPTPWDEAADDLRVARCEYHEGGVVLPGADGTCNFDVGYFAFFIAPGVAATEMPTELVGCGG